MITARTYSSLISVASFLLISLLMPLTSGAFTTSHGAGGLPGRIIERLVSADATLTTAAGTATTNPLGRETTSNALNITISTLALDIDEFAPTVTHSGFTVDLAGATVTTQIDQAIQNSIDISITTSPIRLRIPSGIITYSLDSQGRVFAQGGSTPFTTSLTYQTPLGSLSSPNATGTVIWSISFGSGPFTSGPFQGLLSVVFDFDDGGHSLSGTDPISGLPLTLDFGATGKIGVSGTIVPEPSTALMVALGLGCLGARRRR